MMKGMCSVEEKSTRLYLVILCTEIAFYSLLSVSFFSFFLTFTLLQAKIRAPSKQVHCSDDVIVFH